MDRRPTILLADDHVLVAQGVERLLGDVGDVSTVFSGEALVEALQGGRPDLVICDISMGVMSGIDALRESNRRGFGVPFLMLSMHADPELVAVAIEMGARGYVVKSAAGEELLSAALTVLGGGSFVSPHLAAELIQFRKHAARRALVLTEKQQQVLDRLARGLRCKQIAYELGVTVRTIESHKYTLMQSLQVHNTVELLRVALKHGLLSSAWIGAPAQSAVRTDQ